MAAYTISSNVVGLIVRGKQNDKHSPDKLAQHADCILPGGEPVGYFGGAGDASSGSSGSFSGSSVNSWANGPSLSWNNSGLNMKGQVAFHGDLLKIRPFYVNAAAAKKYKVISTVLLIETTKSQADKFKQYWKNLSLNPGTFNIIGGNCSTNASDAFIAANIVASGIPGLDTPNNLYKQLKAKHTGKIKIFSGFIGARKISGSQYELIVE